MTALHFEGFLEAAEPPPVRDEVRLMIAQPGRAARSTRSFLDLADHLEPGDLLVVNDSATLPAALPALRADGEAVDLHLSTPDPSNPSRWVVEVRSDGRRARARAETLKLPARRTGAADRALPQPEPAVGRAARPSRAAARLPRPPRRADPLRPRADRAAARRSPDDLRHRAGQRRDAERRPPVHQARAGAAARARDRRPAHHAPHRRQLAGTRRAARIRSATGSATTQPSASTRAQRVIAVGTTVVRALETVADEDGVVHAGEGWTSLVDHARARRARGRRPPDRLARAGGEPSADARGLRGPPSCSSAPTPRPWQAVTAGTSSATCTCYCADTPMLRPCGASRSASGSPWKGPRPDSGNGSWTPTSSSGPTPWARSTACPAATSPPAWTTSCASCEPDDREQMGQHVQAALEHGTPYEMDLRVVLPDKGLRWLHARARAVRTDGRTERITGLLSDITERRQREEAHAFLDAASQVLAKTLDPVETLEEVARLAVPALADWCAVQLTDDAHAIAVAHVDPEKVRWARELQDRYPPDPDAPHRRARGDPLRPLGALPRDRPRAARGRRARRGADRARPRAADALGDGRPADRPRAHARGDDVRLGRVRAPVLDARARAGRGGRPPRRDRARPRAPVRPRARRPRRPSSARCSRRRCRSSPASSSSSATSPATRATTPAATGTTRSSCATGGSGS